MPPPRKTVDDYLAKEGPWREELRRLVEILRRTSLEETVKWGAPCYVAHGHNVVGIGGFKSYFGLWFFQGALLQDEAGVLINAQEGKTQGMRQWRMQDAAQIDQDLILQYVGAAIALAADDKRVAPRGAELTLCDALTDRLAHNTVLSAAFAALRPGQQREYAEYIAQAKRAETRARRLDKVTPMIIAGVGLNDRYR